MRFMVIVKASKDLEAGVMPSTELLTAMGKFNEELVKAGVMEAGEGLHPSSKGARISIGAGRAASAAVRFLSPAISSPASGSSNQIAG